MRVEKLLHDEQGREDGHQDVDGEKGRLERPIDRAVMPPRTDRDPGLGRGIATLDALLAALGRRTGSSRLPLHPACTPWTGGAHPVSLHLQAVKSKIRALHRRGFEYEDLTLTPPQTENSFRVESEAGTELMGRIW
jgi:hypothetical protein